MTTIWNLSVTVTYSDDSWETAELVKDKNGFRSFGPDVSKLLEIKHLIADIGLIAGSGSYYRSDVTDVVYRFSAITTNGHVHVAGGVENYFGSDNIQAVSSALFLDSDFYNALNIQVDIDAVLAGLNLSHQSIADIIENKCSIPDLSSVSDYELTGRTDFQGYISYAMIDMDGKYMIVLRCHPQGSSWSSFVIRLNSDFSLDTTFNIFSVDTNSISQFSNKKYLLCDPCFVRISNEGDLEPWDTTPTVYDYYYAIGDNINDPQSPAFPYTARVITPNHVQKAIILGDGTILALANIIEFDFMFEGNIIESGAFARPTVVRLDSNGKPLSSFNFMAYGLMAMNGNFGTNANNCWHYVKDFTLAEDGNSFYTVSRVAGYFNEQPQGRAIRKINIDSTLNQSFGYVFNYNGNPSFQYTPANMVFVEDHASIYTPDGQGSAIILSQGNKLIVCNIKSMRLTSYSDPFTNRNMIIRLNADGTYDNTFEPNVLSRDCPEPKPSINAVIRDGNGIIVSGAFYSLDQTQYDVNDVFVGDIRKNIVRISNDGTVDNSYGYPDYIFNHYSLYVDGLILDESGIARAKTTGYPGGMPGIRCNETSQFYGLAKLDSNGRIDEANSIKAPFTMFGPAKHIGVTDGWYDFYFINYIYTNLIASFDNVKDYSYYPYIYDAVPKTNSPQYFPTLYTDDIKLSYSNADLPITKINFDNLFPKDGSTKPGHDYFGPGSTYFTNAYPGFSVLFAKNISINEYSCVGELNYWDHEPNILHFDIAGKYTCILKTNRDSYIDPFSVPFSVNQIFLIPGSLSGLSYEIVPDAYTDDTCVRGLSDRDHLIHLTIVTYNDNHDVLSQQNAAEIATSFLQSAGLI